MTDTKDIEKAILKATALHALLLGAKADADAVASEAQVKLQGLKSAYEANTAEQRARVETAQTAIEDAIAELKAYQDQVQKDTGAVIDLLKVVAVKSSTEL